MNKKIILFFKLAIVIIVSCLIASAILFARNEERNVFARVTDEERYVKELIPLRGIECDDLFRNGSAWEKYGVFAEDFLAAFRDHQRHLTIVASSHGIDLDSVAGSINLLKKMQLFYIRLVQLPFVRTVCEVGFNTGHSALLCLQSNKNVKVYSFDTGYTKTMQDMADYLQKKFQTGERLCQK